MDAFTTSGSVLETVNHLLCIPLFCLLLFLLQFITQPQDDKAKRTLIHKVVKERFSGRMVSETAEGTMRLRMHKKKDDFGTLAYRACS